MPQTSVSTDNDALWEGQLVYPELPNEVVSKEVGESGGIDFGRTVVLISDKIYLPRSNKATFDLTAALVSGDVVALSVVVNGSTTALTNTTYATSHAATMASIETKIEAVSGIASATVSGNSITVYADAETDIYLTGASVTNGGAGTAVASVTNTCSYDPFGITKSAQVEPDADGNFRYEEGDTASVMRDSIAATRSDDALSTGDVPFFRFYDQTATATDKQTGMLASAAGSSPTKAKLWSAATADEAFSAGGLGKVRVRI